jgi:hypothetical protein
MKKHLSFLENLKKNYPTYNMGKHIATAFADYTDVWGLSDKVFSFPLLNYVIELE